MNLKRSPPYHHPAMSITCDKKNFLSHISAGVGIAMSWLSDEIYLHQDEDIEIYIKNKILEAPVDRHCRPNFSEDKFRQAMDTIGDQTLRELLEYLDQRDITMHRAYTESCMVPKDFPQELADIADTVASKVKGLDDGRELTFARFLEL